jgi:ribonuclease P protein 1
LFAFAGAFVDKSQCEPLSLAKAKKEGLRMAKFPLDKYLQWQRGIKSLTLNQVR